MGKRGQNAGTRYRLNDGRWEGDEPSKMVLVRRTTQDWRVQRSRGVKRRAAAVGISTKRLIPIEQGHRALPTGKTHMEARA